MTFLYDLYTPDTAVSFVYSEVPCMHGMDMGMDMDMDMEMGWRLHGMV